MPNGWATVALGKLVTRRDDFTQVVPDAQYKVVGVQRSGWGLVDREPIRGDDMKFRKLMELEEDNLVYRTITAFEAPSTVVGPAFAGAFVTPQTFPVFRIEASRLLPAYMKLLTTSPGFHNDMADRCTGTVLRRKTISVGAFCSIPIALPSLAEQQRIVDLIGALDEAIEAADQYASATENAYQGSLSLLGNLGFPVVRVADVVSRAKAGGTPSRKLSGYFGGDVHWLKSGEVNSDAIESAEEFITESGLNNSSAWVAPAGSTVVAMYGQGDTKGTAGYLLTPMAMNQAVIALVPDDARIDSRLLLHTMRSRTGSLRRRAVGAAQPNLSKDIVVSEEIPLPPRGDQGTFVEVFDALAAVKRGSLTLGTSLRTLRTNVLAACLGGEHEIPSSYDEVMGVFG